MTVQQSLLKLFIAYNRLCIQTKIQIKNTRKKHTTFDFVCQFFEKVWKIFVILFVHLTRNKIEPSSPAWICACKYLPEGNGLSALTRDTYLQFDQNELQYVPKTSSQLRESDPEYSLVFSSKLKSSTLISCGNSDIIIAKICPFAAIIRPPTKIDPTTVLKNACLSSVRFLEIEYSCGGLPPITIDIPVSHFVVDNELLSKTYILRYLEHLPTYSNWIFNENLYKVKIIDYDSDMVCIGSDQYILLENDEYRVMNKSTPFPE